MGETINALKEIFGNLFRAKMWIVSAVGVAAIFAIVLVLLFAGAIAVLFSLLFISFGGIGLALAILIWLAFGLLALAIFLVFAGIVDGMYLKAAEGLFSKKDYSLEELFNSAKAKWKTLALVILVILLLNLLIAAIAFAPAIIKAFEIVIGLQENPAALLPIAALASQSDPMPIYSALFELFREAIVLAAVGLIFCWLVMFLLSPFLALFMPVAVFEDKGAIDSIKKAFSLGSKNYLRNLSILLPLNIFSLAVGGIGLLASLASGGGGIVSMFFSFVTEIVAFSAAAKIYLLNSRGK